VFAACNPHRKKKEGTELAFEVKRPPISIGQIMWNFGSLNTEEMAKYIERMLEEFDNC
jgi:hypothetical protein